MNLEDLLNCKTLPKKDDLTDEDLARLFIKYKGLLKKIERDKAFWAATNENLKRAYSKLDELVEERTIELKTVNEQLQQELNKRKRAEEKIKEYSEKLEKKVLDLEKSIIERKRAEKRVTESERQYRKAYQRVDLYKDLFAHDVNNLLQSIQSAVDMILVNKDSLDQRFSDRMIAIIDVQVRRGKRLVENITKLSEIEDKKAFMKVVDAYSVLIQSIEYIHTCFPDKTINIKVDSENKELKILFNDLLSDIFDNILLNAVLHNNNEVIQILIKISKTQENNRQYNKIEFIDNGIGIPDNRKNAIFKGIYRSGKDKIGMGLGLSLVSKIIKKVKGDIRVEDNIKGDYSKGSNFILLFPEGN